MPNRKKHRTSLGRRGRQALLGGVFAAAVLGGSAATLAGAGTANAATATPAAAATTAASANVPAQLNMFGSGLTEVDGPGGDSDTGLYNNVPRDWIDMLQAQQSLMQNPTFAKAYNAYMAQFDYLKGKPYDVMANAVNEKVRKDIKYVTDQKLYGQDIYWAAAAQTIKKHAGDAANIAIVDFFVMKHLGVSDDRLFVVQLGGTQKNMNICVWQREKNGACEENPKYKDIEAQYPPYLNANNPTSIQYNALVVNTAANGESPSYAVLDNGAFKTRNAGKGMWQSTGLNYAINEQGYRENQDGPGNANNTQVLPMTYGQVQAELQGRINHYIEEMNNRQNASHPGLEHDIEKPFRAVGEGVKDAVPDAKDAALIALLGLVGIGMVAGAIKSREFRTGILLSLAFVAAAAGIYGTGAAMVRDHTVTVDSECYYGDNCYNVSSGYVDYMYSGGPVDDGTTAPNPAHAPPGLNNFKGWLPLEIPGADILVLSLCGLGAAAGKHDQKSTSLGPRTSGSAPPPPPPPPPKEPTPHPRASDGKLPEAVPLTAGEAALAKSIFGDEIKTAGVNKYHYADKDIPGKYREKKANGSRTAALAYGSKIIEFFGEDSYAADYSHTEDAGKYGIYTHEITHIWQDQSLSQTFNGAASEGYEYALSHTSRFKDFGAEQQAAIIEDYTQRFLFSGGAASHWIKNTHENDELLKKVVEERFPKACKTRLSLGR